MLPLPIMLRSPVVPRALGRVICRGFSTTTAPTQTQNSGPTSPPKSNLSEAAEAAGLTKPDVSEALLGRLKDKGLIHTAGYIGGKWQTASANGVTFQVGWGFASWANSRLHIAQKRACRHVRVFGRDHIKMHPMRHDHVNMSM